MFNFEVIVGLYSATVHQVMQACTYERGQNL